MNNNINTLEQLAEYINNNSEWPLDVEDIIERNGWISDCSEALGVCHDANGNRVVINEQGEVEVNYSAIDNIGKVNCKWKPKYQKLEELVPYIEGGRLCTAFNYEVDKKRHFKSICTDVLPDVNTMRLIYDCQMRVQVELELTIKGNKITYSINHLRLSDYEWVENK